jgi:hypothetical protein
MSKQTFLVSSAFILGLMFMSVWNAYNTPEVICNRIKK